LRALKASLQEMGRAGVNETPEDEFSEYDGDCPGGMAEDEGPKRSEAEPGRL